MSKMLLDPPFVPRQQIVLVDDGQTLTQVLSALADSPFVALDTEFMRESTYFPKLCLVQLATLTHCAIVDPLVGLDLAALWEFLADRRRVKVLHAARQDLEVLAPFSAALPGPIFDTQIAAALLGHPAQIGYANLVSAVLSHGLAKGQTRTDWSRRPLSMDQVEYAADDVRYLAPLYLRLREQLEQAGRLQWLEEETREMEHPELYRTSPEAAWRRLKGLDRLKPEQRAVAKRLATWREELAIRADKPRGWILADDSLRSIADRLPATAEALAQIRTLPPAVLRKRGTELLELVRQGVENASQEEEPSEWIRPSQEQVALATRLLATVRSEAERLNVSPEMLATRRDIEQLAFFGIAKHLTSGWRGHVIGERLLTQARELAQVD